MSAERHSSWESEEVLLNALAAVNNLTYYATGDELWSQRLGEGEWVRRSGEEGRSNCDRWGYLIGFSGCRCYFVFVTAYLSSRTVN